MTILLMCWSFFKAGLFAVGGGLATIPFLYEMSDTFGWFSHQDILNMLAIAESTPGAIGINMATYSGFNIGKDLGGIAGAIGSGILATLSLALPSVIVILIIARVLDKFRSNRFVNGAFYVLRPASTALIGAAALGVVTAVFFDVEKLSFDAIIHPLLYFTHFNWKMGILFVVIFVLMKIKPLSKLHPICFIALAAAAGIVFKL